MVPTLPTAMAHPLTAGRSSVEYQSAKAFSAAIRPAAIPNPINARPANSETGPFAMANNTQPAAPSSINVDSTRRGPKRSSKTPSGS
jgi:hypothetical protein